MTDRIVYLVTNSGMDGRAKEHIDFADYSESARDKWYEKLGKNRCYYSKTKRIVETIPATKQALARINGLDRLLLGIEMKPIDK